MRRTKKLERGRSWTRRSATKRAPRRRSGRRYRRLDTNGSAQGGRAVTGRFRALTLRIVARHTRNPQPVVVEHAVAAFVLHATMLREVAPRRHSGLVAPIRNCDHLAVVGHALKALDRYESVDLADQRHEGRRHIEVGLLSTGLRPRLEDDDDHSPLSCRCRTSGCHERDESATPAPACTL